MNTGEPDPSTLSTEPVLVLKAYRKTDAFTQLVGGDHFAAKVESIDCSKMSALVILAEALGEIAQEEVGAIDCADNPTKEQARDRLLQILTLPAEALSAAQAQHFARNTNSQEDQ
ncbi:hypothetical protein [Corynebacterium sp.]|uniref:hypothetical protein n=1 Tax=Corynebacterium sp. TaxID=1720 RepID=UPI0025C674B2|nr:hypothetical protein [Corynebacterium sp.]